MRGVLGGILAGGLVSVVGLGAVSVISERPAGILPPQAPAIDAPRLGLEPAAARDGAPIPPVGTNGPVGSVEIVEPMAPALPDGEEPLAQPDIPDEQDADEEARVPDEAETRVPSADTAPPSAPDVVSIEGAMQAPEAAEGSGLFALPVAPVIANPQSNAPEAPSSEAEPRVSTRPIQPDPVLPVIKADPDIGSGGSGADIGDPIETIVVGPESQAPEAVDIFDAPVDTVEDDILASARDAADTITPGAPAARVQLQGSENALLAERENGVTIRRFDTQPSQADSLAVAAPANALALYAAQTANVGNAPLMAIVLIDDGSMPNADLSGLPFDVTIALDPAMANARELMNRYRAQGVEIVVMAKLPNGALPRDVEVTFESVFRTLPETIAILDTGDGGLQVDREVTEQAIAVLSDQGRGLITVNQGLNMAKRAAELAGVPSVTVERDLDGENQDARIVRRFLDQAAFRARQNNDVVLVGTIRPETISALIEWGTSPQTMQVAITPVSAILLKQ